MDGWKEGRGIDDGLMREHGTGQRSGHSSPFCFLLRSVQDSRDTMSKGEMGNLAGSHWEGHWSATTASSLNQIIQVGDYILQKIRASCCSVCKIGVR